MSKYNEEFRFENGVLYVRLSGVFPNELLDRKENLFQPLIDACSAHNCMRALVDARDLQVNFGTFALLRAGEDGAVLSRLGLRVALLASANAVDPFFEVVVTNRGGHLGIFTDIGAASAWIES